METQQAESLQAAMTSESIQLKNLDVNDYMKAIKLIKKLSSFLDERTTDVQTLIKEYNKEYTEKTKSEKFKAAQKKEKEALTPEEQELLSIKPAVQVYERGLLSGPSDFVEKIESINKRKIKLEKADLNFIKDSTVFKSVVENVPANQQVVLYEFLFKQ